MQASLLINQRAAAALTVVIIGPYAAKWFSDRQTEQEGVPVSWIVVSEAGALAEVVERLHARRCRVSAFFPFFPDGEETATRVLTQIAAWQSSLCQQEALPCVLGLYARLSHESVAGQAKWSGHFEFSKSGETTLARELERRLAIPETLSCHAVYRHAMTKALRLWLEESGIARALHTLFSGSSLRLSAVLLADNGHGFPRHGAWARWLQQKFGLFPGLSPAIMLPDLPMVTVPAPLPPPIRQRAWQRWLPVLLALLLTLSLLGSAWLEATVINKTAPMLTSFRRAEAIHMQEREAIYQQLNEQKRRLLRCSDAWFSQLWRFSQCKKMAARVDEALQNYQPLPVFTAADSVALFAKGSAVLGPDSSKSLNNLLPLIRNSAQTRFVIVGHSDNTGSPESNYRLSIQRAKTVRDWLVEQTQEPPARFMIKGMGDSLPAASNQTLAGRYKNRRVEVFAWPGRTNKKQVEHE